LDTSKTTKYFYSTKGKEEIGIFLVSNGWGEKSLVSNDTPVYFSYAPLNPEKKSNRHFVTITSKVIPIDTLIEPVIYAIEDYDRDNGSDEDMSDIVLCISRVEIRS
jgi:hypothetical protein